MSRVASSLRLTTARRRTATDETLSSSQQAKSNLADKQVQATAFDCPKDNPQPLITNNSSTIEDSQHASAEPKLISSRPSFTGQQTIKVLDNRLLLRDRPVFVKLQSNHQSTTEGADKSSDHRPAQWTGCQVGIRSRSDGAEALNRKGIDSVDIRLSRLTAFDLQSQPMTSKLGSPNAQEPNSQQSKLNEILNRPIPKPISLSDEEMRSIISQAVPLKPILNLRRVWNLETCTREKSMPQRSVMPAGQVAEPLSSTTKKVTFSKNKIVKIFRQQPSMGLAEFHGERSG